jgi:hypothetical protein
LMISALSTPCRLDRGDPEVAAVAELALDDDQRHAFAGHLDRVCVPQLVGEASAHAGFSGCASEFGRGYAPDATCPANWRCRWSSVAKASLSPIETLAWSWKRRCGAEFRVAAESETSGAHEEGSMREKTTMHPATARARRAASLRGPRAGTNAAVDPRWDGGYVGFRRAAPVIDVQTVASRRRRR